MPLNISHFRRNSCRRLAVARPRQGAGAALCEREFGRDWPSGCGNKLAAGGLGGGGMWPGSTASRPCGGKTRFEARATGTGGLGTAGLGRPRSTQLTTGARCRASLCMLKSVNNHQLSISESQGTGVGGTKRSAWWIRWSASEKDDNIIIIPGYPSKP